MKDRERREPLVHIATAPNEWVAKMWSGILEEHGIRCLLKGRGLQAAMYASPLTVNWDVHVLESQAEKASEILALDQLAKEKQAGLQSELADLTGQQQEEEIPTFKYTPGECPYCDSKSVSQRIIEGPLARRDREIHGYYYKWDCQCFDCEKRWWGIE